MKGEGPKLAQWQQKHVAMTVWMAAADIAPHALSHKTFNNVKHELNFALTPRNANQTLLPLFAAVLSLQRQ